jgi:diaminopimelate epimerase
MGYEIVIADPAKNITLLVLTPVPPEERARVAKALLDDPSLGAEQVGFVIPPSGDGASGRGATTRSAATLRRASTLRRAAPLWRLEMMGGEFCGNAARSFGLYVARRTGLSGKVRLEIGISGMETTVSVRADLDRGLAEASMPPALAEKTLVYRGAALPVYVFEGIVHAIALDIPASETAFYEIRAILEAGFEGGALFDAVGVMFYDRAAQLMTPAVYVRATDTLVFESSCGSGSAALGLYLARSLDHGETTLALRQPGGTIEVRVEKQPGAAAAVSIGGPVTLSEAQWRP